MGGKKEGVTLRRSMGGYRLSVLFFLCVCVVFSVLFSSFSYYLRGDVLLYKCLFTLSKQRARHWAMRIGEPKSCGAASATKSRQQAAKITNEIVEFILRVMGVCRTILKITVEKLADIQERLE